MKKCLFLFFCCLPILSKAQIIKVDTFIMNNLDYFIDRIIEGRNSNFCVNVFTPKIDSGKILSVYLTNSVNVAYKVIDSTGLVKVNMPDIPKSQKKPLFDPNKVDSLFISAYPELNYKRHKYKIFNIHYEYSGLQVLVVQDSTNKVISFYDLCYIE